MHLRRTGHALLAAGTLAVSLSACGTLTVSTSPTQPQAGTATASNVGAPTEVSGSSTDSSKSSDAQESSDASDSSEQSSRTSTTDPGTGSADSAAVAECDANALQASFGHHEEPGTSSQLGYINVRNISGKSCHLRTDYPWVQFTNREAQPSEGIGYLQDTSMPPVSITLAPNESASSRLYWQEDGPSQSIVWALNMTVRPGDRIIEMDPTDQGQPGQTFPVGSSQVYVGAFRKDG
ncbi:DUF4232 domain-containing protein [Saccharopolyspora rosea]|uniref:DUF4232 domain-containing protein n=1 Tax=Saccharopolyspora rosea TaxID=524884 RepID=A0ABW3G3X0_9PSEU|nr:DUF4232 domain-containing protein [Saccharopolyspora rosea]